MKLGTYKEAISNDICSKCGADMTTRNVSCTSPSQCVCVSDAMSVISDSSGSHCECNPGYSYDYQRGLCVGCVAGM